MCGLPTDVVDLPGTTSVEKSDCPAPRSFHWAVAYRLMKFAALIRDASMCCSLCLTYTQAIGLVAETKGLWSAQH